MVYIFISLYFIIFLYIFLRFYEIIKRFITTSSTYYLLKSLYNININIKSHTISNKIIKLTKKKQFQYLLNECKYIEYFLTKEQIDLINLINEYRIKYNLEKLLFDKNNRIPDFIIKKPSEVMLNPAQNIFQLSQKEYLFRYPIGNFKIQFQNKENNMIRILSNNDINFIKIIGQKEYEYIYLCELSYNEKFLI